MRSLDVLAAIVALALLGTMIAFPLLGATTGDEIQTAFGVAMGWVFRGGANGINGAMQRRRNNANGKDTGSPTGHR